MLFQSFHNYFPRVFTTTFPHFPQIHSRSFHQYFPGVFTNTCRTDQQHSSSYWILSGYFPLLVCSSRVPEGHYINILLLLRHFQTSTLPNWEICANFNVLLHFPLKSKASWQLKMLLMLWTFISLLIKFQSPFSYSTFHQSRIRSIFIFLRRS